MVSKDARRLDDKLYILADRRSLGPPSLPFPRGMASTWTMLMMLARLRCLSRFQRPSDAASLGESASR